MMLPYNQIMQDFTVKGCIAAMLSIKACGIAESWLKPDLCQHLDD
jgi:hypothetical protein